MGKISLQLDEELLRKLTARASQEGTSLKVLVNRLLQIALQSQEKQKYEFKLKGWNSELQPGIDISNRNTYLDLLDDETGSDST